MRRLLRPAGTPAYTGRASARPRASHHDAPTMTLDPTTLIMSAPDGSHPDRAPRAPRPRPLSTALSTDIARPLPASRAPITTSDAAFGGMPEVLETEAGVLSLGPDGIVRVRVREDRWVDRAAVEAFIAWLEAYCPGGAPLLIDKRSPYALDFAAQQAIMERLRAPAAALLIASIDKLPLVEYARETYLRRIETRIFRSEAHALRWLSTFVEPAPFLPLHDLIEVPDPKDLEA